MIFAQQKYKVHQFDILNKKSTLEKNTHFMLKNNNNKMSILEITQSN